jgi:hypothetical protein
MTKEDVFQNLCIYDPRNPDYINEELESQSENSLLPRTNCYCDNCFRGKTPLATEILKLQKLLDKKQIT